VTAVARRSRAPRPQVVRVRGRAAVAIGLTSLAGIAMFCWPLLLQPGDGVAHRIDAPLAFVLLLPALLAVVFAEVSEGGLDARALAMLGVLSALRPMGAGTAGIETIFFLLVLAGRVYGPGFGFVLGSTTVFTSALLTAGVGPWLPFQMLAASWVGMGGGLLPRASGRRELAVLAVYGAVAGYAYGLLLNLWAWPFTIGAGGSVSYLAGASVLDNLHRFWLYTIATSTWGWDTGRAVTNVVAILVVGPAVLAALRRASRRAAFDAPISFDADGV
jgi:energy-coupling factor transport system substrate-specific component